MRSSGEVDADDLPERPMSEVEDILDESRWLNKVSPEQLRGINVSRTDEDEKVLAVKGHGLISFTAFNVLTFTAHNPEAVWGYMREKHEVFYNGMMSRRSEDELTTELFKEDSDINPSFVKAVPGPVIRLAARAMMLFQGTAADDAEQAMRAHRHVHLLNYDEFKTEISRLRPTSIKYYYFGAEMPTKLAPADELSSDAMDW